MRRLDERVLLLIIAKIDIIKTFATQLDNSH